MLVEVPWSLVRYGPGVAAGVAVDVWALEKNPNAFVLLQRHNAEEWNGVVSIVKSDMRSWTGPISLDGNQYFVDILVSELLGSFGDNELSPECLDGVQHVLNPNYGISIPSSYNAFVTPIATPRLYASIVDRAAVDKEAFETPYVVMLHAMDYLSSYTLDSMSPISAEEGTNIRQEYRPLQPVIKEVWSFEHPLSPNLMLRSATRRGGGLGSGCGGSTGGDGTNEHNSRFSRVTFVCKNRGVCHGLAGYFETVLYRGVSESVELSTNPLMMEAKSKDMISWFPIFYPLKVGHPPFLWPPLHLKGCPSAHV